MLFEHPVKIVQYFNDSKVFLPLCMSYCQIREECQQVTRTGGKLLML